MAHKVFSKHSSSEIREWTKQLMKSYQLLHAVEKPMNLDYVQPFANTSDLKEFTPKLDPKLAEERRKEREFKMKQGVELEEKQQVTINLSSQPEQGSNTARMGESQSQE